MGSKTRRQALRVVHPRCAGIDAGKARHYVAVAQSAAEHPVRSFASFPDESEAMARWLKSCAVDRVAMEAMGVYRIAVFEVLDRAGSEWTRARPGRPVAARATCSTARGSGGSMGRGCSMQDRLMAGTGSWRAALAGTKRRHRIIGPGSPFGILRPTGAAASRHSRDGGR